MSYITSILQENGVLNLSISRPKKRNALSRSLIEELTQAIIRADSQQARVIVISGEGSCFSAGADFSDLAGTGSDEQYDQEIEGLTNAIRSSKLVVVAAIHGVCIGA